MKMNSGRPYSLIVIISILLLLQGCDGDSGGSQTTTDTTDITHIDAIYLSVGNLDQLFQSHQTEYTATVGYLVKSLYVTAWTENEQASLSIDGVPTLSGSSSHAIELNEGVNTIILSVTADEGVTTRDYSLTVLRQSLQAFAQTAYVKASNTEAVVYDPLVITPEGKFGNSVSLSGDTLAVGVCYEDSAATGVNGDQTDNSAPDAGAVYVFGRENGGWRQQAYLKASNTEFGDCFGSSVSLSGDTLAVGASHEDSSGFPESNERIASGAVYLFSRANGVWRQQAYLKASNTEASDFFGSSLSLSGDTLAVGAFNEGSVATGVNGDQTDNSAGSAGAVYLFSHENGVWRQQAYLKASNTESGDGFGGNMSLSGDILAVGAPDEDSAATGVNGDQTDNSAGSAGAVYLFSRENGMWRQQAYLKASNAETGDEFGGFLLGDSSVSLSGDTLAVGAPDEDSIATGVNGDQADNSTINAGAVYLFQ